MLVPQHQLGQVFCGAQVDEAYVQALNPARHGCDHRRGSRFRRQ